MVRSLVAEGNQVIVLEPEACWTTLDSNLASIELFRDIKMFDYTFGIFRDMNPDFIAKCAGLLSDKQFDLVELQHPSGMLTVKILGRLLRHQVPVVYAAHNLESEFMAETFALDKGYSRMTRRLVTQYATYLEKAIVKHVASHTTVPSERDRRLFIKKHGMDKADLSVIPFGCRFLKRVNQNEKDALKDEIGIGRNRLVVFFHGLYSHPPNKYAFRVIQDYIAPIFELTDKRVLFVLGGTGMPRFEKANVKCVGYIDDLSRFLSLADIALVPLIHGAGVKLKVLDYLGAGLPIVSTKKGVEGINVRHQEEALIVDTVDRGFIEAIRYLVGNDAERARLGANAHRLAKREHDWGKIGYKLNELYSRIVSLESTA